MQKVRGEQFANVCPSIAKYNFHAYSAGGRLNIASSMLKNGFTWSDRMIDIVYNCQMCGACGVSCNYAMDMEVLEPIHEFRMKTIEDGHVNPSLEKTVERMKQSGSMVPVRGKRGDWANGLDVKNALKEKVSVLLHVGCLTSYDKDMQKLAVAAVKILKKAGVDFGIAGDEETCCGGRAYQMGYKQAFLDQAKKNMAVVEKAGVKTVVVLCADGYQAFKVLYERYGLRGKVEVLHISEYIAGLIKEGRLKLRRNVNLAVTYHDPCRLGRLGEEWVHWE
jgi:Fe-S oxidoreductase